MKPLESGRDGGRWLLADPQQAVDFVGTQRRRDDALADELPADDEATVWAREHIGHSLHPDRLARLVDLRALLRELFAAIVESTPLPAQTLDTINQLAARAPVTLAAYHDNSGIVLERTSDAAADALLQADLARCALTLLAEPARTRLRLCRAPGCTLFFLTDRPRQQWCSPSCGNRARVARHYRRHQPGSRSLDET